MVHGLNPLYSTAMGYPHGVNLLANTSDVAVGVVLAPITWAFGPIATLNVALTIAPALSALAMFVLLRRWTSWALASFVGGLLYGFSPMVLSNFTDAHVNVTTLVIPPLVVVCLDELLGRQARRPIATGVLLGTLLAVQFFLGTEYLLIMVMLGVIGVACVILHARMKSPLAYEVRAPAVITGFKAAGVTGAVLLAYPAWFALMGPSNLPGPIWGGSLNQFASNFRWYFFAPHGGPGASFGYGGLYLTDQYLGFGLLSVLVCGIAIWRRDRRLWLFAALGVVAIALALGAADQVFGVFPLVENIVPSRFNMVVYFCAAVTLGIILDHVHQDVDVRASGGGSESRRHGARTRAAGFAAAIAALLVATLAVGPIVAYWSHGLPIATRPVVLPAWFKDASVQIGSHQVLLVLPYSVSQESPMTWQALDDMRFSMVDEGGPGGAPMRGGKERKAETILSIISSPAIDNVGYSAEVKIVTPEKIASVRDALAAWGVTTVVIPDALNLPYYDVVPSDAAAAALITAAVGRQPSYQRGAWVWSNVRRVGPTILISAGGFAECVDAGSPHGAGVSAATRCVVGFHK